MSGFQRLIKNSIANIINGFSNVILGIVISPFLVLAFSLSDFALWNLIIQVGAFFSVIGFGIQLTVSRFVTLARTNNDVEYQNAVIKYGLAISFLGVFISSIVVFLLFNNFYSLFPSISIIQSPNGAICLALVSFSFIVGMIFSVYTGYFIGVERNDIPAGVNLFSRCIIGVVIYLFADYGLLTVSALYFSFNILSYGIIYCFFKFERKSFNLTLVGTVKKLNFTYFINYFAGITLFNASMFLIVNFNSIIVAKFSFDDYAFFSVAMIASVALVGFVNAAISPMLQPITRLSTLDSNGTIDNIVYNLTWIVVLFVSLSVSCSLLFSSVFLEIWLGKEFSIKSETIFILLLAASLLRLVGAPLGIVYLAKARQNEIMFIPLAEGILSVFLTLLLVGYFGMYAVPFSLFISGVIVFFIYSMRLILILESKSIRNKLSKIFTVFPITLSLFFTAYFYFGHLWVKSFIYSASLVIMVFSFWAMYNKIKVFKKIVAKV